MGKKRVALALAVVLIVMSMSAAATANVDNTPPTISDVSIDKQGQALKPGDSFTVRCRVTDASGLKRVTCRYHWNVGWTSGRSMQYNASTGYYEAKIEIRSNELNGQRYLAGIEAEDIYFNESTVDFEKNRIHWVNVTGGGDDYDPPVISDISISKQGQTLKPGQTFIVRCKVQDRSEIVNVGFSVCLDLNLPMADRMQHQLYETKAHYNIITGCYESLFTIPKDAHNGKWYLHAVEAEDIYWSIGSVDLEADKSHWINVTGGIDDNTGPVVSEVNIDKNGQNVEIGDTFVISFKAQDESGIHYNPGLNLRGRPYGAGVWTYGPNPAVRFAHSGGSVRFNQSFEESAIDDVYEVKLVVPPDAKLGRYDQLDIYVRDIYRNQTELHSGADVELSDKYINIVPATKSYVDGDIGVGSDGKILGVPANEKYLIRANYGTWKDKWFQVQSDGRIGEPYTLTTRYRDIPVLKGEEITGTPNGYRFTIIKAKETAIPTEDIKIPGLPLGTSCIVYELTPFDTMHQFLTTQKKATEQCLGVYDIDVSGDIPEKGVFVSFNVGTDLAGRTLNVLHYHFAKLERYSGVVDEYGVLTIRVYGFSPFMVVIPDVVNATTASSAISSGMESQAQAMYTVTVLDNGNPYTEFSLSKTFSGGGVYIFKTDATVYVNGQLVQPDKDGIYSVIVNRDITITLGSGGTSPVADVPATGGDAPYGGLLLALFGAACILRRRRIG